MLRRISLPISSGEFRQTLFPLAWIGVALISLNRRLVLDTVLYGIVVCQFINWSIHKGRTERKLTRYLVVSLPTSLSHHWIAECYFSVLAGTRRDRIHLLVCPDFPSAPQAGLITRDVQHGSLHPLHLRIQLRDLCQRT